LLTFEGAFPIQRIHHKFQEDASSETSKD
jgi:hypothetical protein